MEFLELISILGGKKFPIFAVTDKFFPTDSLNEVMKSI